MKKKIFFYLLIPLLIFPLSFCKKQEDLQNTDKLKLICRNFNVLLITIDTLRYDRLGIYSDAYVKTPNIDKISKKSTVFKKAFSHTSLTLPSHVNILTGTTPLYHGISDNLRFRLEERFLTISKYLKERGYNTGAFIGAFPLDSRFGLNKGFDIYDDNYNMDKQSFGLSVERKAEEVIKPAVKWINNQNSKWFSWVHLFDPHAPYDPPLPFKKEYENDLYSGEIAYIDLQIGTLFDFLEKKNLMGKTVIVLTSDHGEALGEKGESTHGYFAYNNTIHIPLIIYLPGNSFKIINENVSHIDIFPTLCEILEIEIPTQIQGESLIPVIRGEKRNNNLIYFESMSPYLNMGWAPLRGFIKNDLKFIDLPIKEVYDINIDINEEKNLSSESGIIEFKNILDKLIKKFEGKAKIQRSKKIDIDTQKKLESLGYLTSNSTPVKKEFYEKDDLKTLLPVRKRCDAALNDFRAGRYEAAVKELKSTIEQYPNFISLIQKLSKIYEIKGRIDLSIEVLKTGLEKNPEAPELLSMLGKILATKTNRKEEGIKILLRYIKKAGNNLTSTHILCVIGKSFVEKGEIDRALEFFNRALSFDAHNMKVYKNIGLIFAETYKKKEKSARIFNLSMEYFNKAIESDPGHYSAFLERGKLFKENREVEKALKDLVKAIEINPDYMSPYLYLGLWYLERGEKSMAFKYLSILKKKFYSRLNQNQKQRLDKLIKAAGILN